MIALNFLHNNFEITTAPLFYLGDKNFKEIQYIATSTKVANMAKQVVGAIADFIMVDNKKNDTRLTK